MQTTDLVYLRYIFLSEDVRKIRLAFFNQYSIQILYFICLKFVNTISLLNETILMY